MIDALAAPEQDGQVLIWSKREPLRAAVDDNRRRLESCSAVISGRPVSEWRRNPSRGPIIMTGHQPSFFHAGVWAKSVVAADLAADLGGRAEFLTVDSDLCHGVPLAWPEVVDGHCRQAQALAAPNGQSHAFEQLGRFDDSVSQIVFDRPRIVGDSVLPNFSAAFRALHQPLRGYTAQWTEGANHLDRRLGIGPLRYVRVSELFSRDIEGGFCAAAFTTHLLRASAEFAGAYNAALADYRQRRGIRGNEHPIPDLSVEPDRVEAPFWLLGPVHGRERLFVACDASGGLTLSTAGDYRCTLAADELETSLPEVLGDRMIRPRALTLTLFARLLACDLFIHGVGGAKYDQITDDIIRRFFAIQPPAYACVSATLQLPLPVFSVSEEDRSHCFRALREIRFNPHRAGAGASSSEAIDRRAAAIAESARLRLHEPKNRGARRAVYEQIHSANAGVLSDGESRVQGVRRRLDEISAKLQSNRIARSREWYFAFHSEARLNQLRGKLRESI